MGEKKRVTFDASKESFHIMSRRNARGGNFKLLGITFDPQLSMYVAIHECVGAADWKLQALLRTKRFFTDAEIIKFSERIYCLSLNTARRRSLMQLLRRFKH